MTRQRGNTRVTAGRTLIRRYVLALTPQGQPTRPRLRQPRYRR